MDVRTAAFGAEKAQARPSKDGRRCVGRGGKGQEQARPGRRVALAGWAVATTWTRHRGTRAEELGQAGAVRVPKGYKKDTLKLVETLRESIVLEADGGLEREVRKKAEPVQGLVREFLTSWSDDKAVLSDASYQEVSSALETLGRFYRARGSRTPLDRTTRHEVLAKLSSAEESLSRLEEAPASGLGNLFPF